MIFKCSFDYSWQDFIWDENSLKFWRTSTILCGWIHANQRWTNNFHQAGNLRNLRAKLCAFGPKMKEILTVFRKSWDFLIKIPIDNWLFHNFLLNISGISASSSNPVFYNYLFDFGGWDVPMFPLPTPMLYITILISYS